MTYNQLFNRVYGPKDVDAAFWATVDEPTKKAWSVMRALKARKGLDWWFEDLDTKLKNEIFADVRKAIKQA